jgi:hypothetical protein
MEYKDFPQKCRECPEFPDLILFLILEELKKLHVKVDNINDYIKKGLEKDQAPVG